MKTILSFSAIGAMLLIGSVVNAADSPKESVNTVNLPIASPKNTDEAIKRLFDGNKRYINNKTICPDRNNERREALTAKQTPFAVIVGCSDSRVSPEIVFDQGVGDLFVVRVAGNIAGGIEVDSIEYGVKHLGAQVILVLGHENCGAVSAVVHGDDADIPSVAALIKPAVAAVRGKSGNMVENAIKMNVHRVVEFLESSKIFQEPLKQKKLAIIGGYYNLHSGAVELLEDEDD